MFAVLAVKVKQNAPRCHTFLEIIYYRYGPVAHIIFIFFALLTNILVASQLLLGGSAVVTGKEIDLTKPRRPQPNKS